MGSYLTRSKTEPSTVLKEKANRKSQQKTINNTCSCTQNKKAEPQTNKSEVSCLCSSFYNGKSCVFFKDQN